MKTTIYENIKDLETDLNNEAKKNNHRDTFFVTLLENPFIKIIQNTDRVGYNDWENYNPTDKYIYNYKNNVLTSTTDESLEYIKRYKKIISNYGSILRMFTI